MDVRWALYAGCLPDGTALAFPGVDLQRHSQRWWVYQANDLSHICFETLLKYVLDALETHPGGIPLARVISTPSQTSWRQLIPNQRAGRLFSMRPCLR
jgi:hypothetical protein